MLLDVVVCDLRQTRPSLFQCEAHADSPHWVNYFLHCGSLQIAGAKMSKSLKNFVSIKQVLQRYSADQIRLLCLMHRWMDTMEYR